MPNLSDERVESLERPMLCVRLVSKSFPGVQALEKVNFDLNAGEIVALAGENGAGKSTLINILAGIHLPDQGEIQIDSKPAEILTVRHSIRLGISIIHQELSLAENLSIAENIFLGKQPFRGTRWCQLTHRRRLHECSDHLLNRLGLAVSSKTRVARLSLGRKQMVEIAKSLAANARIIILDEPTSSLSHSETRRLLDVVLDMKHNGIGIIYVSHRLAEIIEIADRVFVLRNGQNAGVLPKGEITHRGIVSLMIGRDLNQYYHRPQSQIAKTDALRVKDLVYARARAPISFSVRRGEIVGFAGLLGAGRTALARALFGVDRVSSGSILINSKLVNIRHPRDAIDAGLVLLPEERKTQGLFLRAGLADNIGMPMLPRLGRHKWLLNRRAIFALAREQCHALSIAASSLQQKVALLSGGSQQKVVLAKWLAMRPSVFVLDEPTRGIDVGAKIEIYSLISDLVKQGAGVILISSELEEIVAMSDRVIVMHEGRIQGELDGSAITRENIMVLAVGEAI